MTVVADISSIVQRLGPLSSNAMFVNGGWRNNNLETLLNGVLVPFSSEPVAVIGFITTPEQLIAECLRLRLALAADQRVPVLRIHMHV